MSTIMTFEDLQNLGVNPLHEHTHISRPQLELLLNKSFDQLTRVQFMGFVSILEREYAIDLTALRNEYDTQIPKQKTFDGVAPSTVLQAHSTARQKWIIGAIGAIIILVLIASMTQGELSVAPKEEAMQLNSAIVDAFEENNTRETNATADANIPELNISEANISEANISQQRLSTPSQEQNSSVVAESKSEKFENALSINPSSKVWVGMMDIATGKKTQHITKEPIVIDTTKNWLFVFGHGRLQIVTSEGSTTLRERNAVWFAYEDGALQQLSREEFEIKNHGSKW
ncbi:MAG: hypothetical protein ACXWB0_06995 [Sulfuricurvum sp.]